MNTNAVKHSIVINYMTKISSLISLSYMIWYTSSKNEVIHSSKWNDLINYQSWCNALLISNYII
jgi:hypothetical protein